MRNAHHHPPDSGPPEPGLKSRLRHVVLFFAGPFITMYYLARLPFDLPRIVKQLRDPANTDGHLS